MEITIYTEALSKVEKMLEAIKRKGIKHNVYVVYAVGNPYYKSVAVRAIDPVSNIIYTISTKTVEVVDVEITDNVIKANGWTVAAHLEHLDDGKNLVTPINHSESIPSEWYTIHGKCDHCHTKHKRKKTYIVKHESGEYKQVGVSCLQDYTGINPAMAIAWAGLQEIIIGDEMNESAFDVCTGGNAPTVYSVQDVVAAASADIAKHGYRKDGVTAAAVREALDSHQQPDKDSTDTASAVLDMVVNADNLHIDGFLADYISNAANLIASKYCKVKHFGRLVYLPEVFRKVQEQETHNAEKAAAAGKSNYVGKVGEKLEINVESIRLVTSYETHFGCTKIWEIKDSQGNIFIWKTANDCGGFTIKGTVKEHNEYQGIKQTVLTRCKAINICKEE